jgi:Tfp pilus assembly protein PilX
MRGTCNQGSRARRGSALMMSLVAVIGVSALAAGLLQVSAATMRRNQVSLDNRRAFYLAEAGLAEGYAGLAEGRTGNVGTAAAPARYGEGLFWTTSTFLPSGHVNLEATGMCGIGRATLAMVAQPVVSSVTGLGVFSSQSLRVEPSSLIDGYDSRSGSYESQADMSATPPHTSGGAIVGSNAGISVAGGRTGSFIYGDALPGPGSSVTKAGTVTITGSTAPRSETSTLPPVEVPAVTKQAPITHTGPAPFVIPPSTIGYSTLRIGPRQQLVIRGPATVVFDTLLLDAEAEIVVDPTGGRVDLYVEQSLTFASGSLINCLSTNPALCTLMVSKSVDPAAADNVQFNAKGKFYGTLYAPRSNMKISADFEVFGAAVAQKLTLSNGGKLHVDTELAANAESDPLPRMVSWRIVDIPHDVAVSRIDPFAALGVDPASLPLARDAHRDIWLEIRYTDLLLATRTYSGWASGFDFNGITLLSSYRTYTGNPAVDGQPLQEKSSTILGL